MTKVGPIGRTIDRLLGRVRRAMTNNIMKMAVLLAGHCFIRPSDFVPTRAATFHFKRFGWLVPAVPAAFYAAANVALIEHFILTDRTLDIDALGRLTALQQFYQNRIYLRASAFLMVMVACYFFAWWLYVFHKAMCRLLGQNRTSTEHATLKFFLVKSTAICAWFTVFAWAVVIIAKIDPAEWMPRIEFIVTTNTMHIIVIIMLSYFGVKLCATNGRLAMLEIYLTEATYYHMKSIAMLALVTGFMLLAFFPRIFGVAV